MKKTLCLQEINIVVGGTNCECKKEPGALAEFGYALVGNPLSWRHYYKQTYEVSSRAACITQCCGTDQATAWVYGGTYQSPEESGSCACTIL